MRGVRGRGSDTMMFRKSCRCKKGRQYHCYLFAPSSSTPSCGILVSCNEDFEERFQAPLKECFTMTLLAMLFVSDGMAFLPILHTADFFHRSTIPGCNGITGLRIATLDVK